MKATTIRILMFVLALVQPALATTITVNTTADQYGSDTSRCSLREAVRAANQDSPFGGCAAGSGTDVVSLPAGTFLFTRAGRGEDANATGDLDVSAGLVVVGQGAARTIIDAAGLDRAFHTTSANTGIFWLSALTLRGGDPLGGSDDEDVPGGALYAVGSGAVSLSDVHVTESVAGQGGGLFVEGNASGALSISATTFSRNHAIAYGGAVLSRRQVVATNSTFSGNLARCVGSAFYFSDSDAEHILASVTVTDNHTYAQNCVDGPALWNSVSTTSTVRVRNSIIAGNFSGFTPSDCDEITSDDYNLVGDTGDCDILGVTANTMTNVDPQLMPLFDYGNGTPTHMLLPGSPAAGAGNPATPGSGGNACPSADQRGVARLDCDIGAYEYRPTFTVSRSDDAFDPTPGDGHCNGGGGACTLRAAIIEANVRTEPTTIVLPAGTYHVTLPHASNGNGGALDTGGTGAITIVGAGAGTTTIVAEGTQRSVFSLAAQANALLRLSVRGGDERSLVRAGGISAVAETLLSEVEVAANDGCTGGVSLTGHLVAERISVHDNLADVPAGCPWRGGGLHVGPNGLLEMRNSTISRNRAREGGGGLFVDGGIARLTNVTIAGNVADYIGGSGEGGGGIARIDSGAIHLKNSIVAGNASGGGLGPDCAAIVQSHDYNLFGNSADCIIGGTTAHDRVDVPARLAPLGRYGGKLPLHPLLPDSPALDGVGPVGGQQYDRELACRDGVLRSIAADQRGTARPLGYFCDIGAFEGSMDVIFVDAFE